MDLLEFIGSLEALPDANRNLARDKAYLAKGFGLTSTLPDPLPMDAKQTRIPSRAFDGFMAKAILADPTIAETNYCHYAFTTCAIFAAQQLSIRSGCTTRRLNIEYPYFVTRALDPVMLRIIRAVPYIPLYLSLLTVSPQTVAQQLSAGQDSLEAPLKAVNELIQLFADREKTLKVEQALQIIGVNPLDPTLIEGRVSTSQCAPFAKPGLIGLLVLDRLGSLQDYKDIIDRLAGRLSIAATILIHDKKLVAETCYTNLLSSGNQWRGTALKHLNYRGGPNVQDDFTIAALSGTYAYPPELS